MLQVVKIPEERKAVLIGKNGWVKKRIERETGTRVSLNEVVEIEGDYIETMKSANIIKAIGRGFSPERALLLTDEEYDIVIIDIGKETIKARKRLFGRVIGKGGYARKRIEEKTGCFISVYGKTVSIIGPAEELDRALHAVESLLAGRSHGYIYKRLSKR